MSFVVQKRLLKS